ncbi:MAG: rod shape-determining protein [Clostridia bacterium]|nr:rod shape-determining protein [Clostridia bacterium]
MKNIGIDLGTSNTIIYSRGRGIILREPSVVAVDARTKTVKAIGNEAKRMLGKTPGTILAVRPLQNGVIAEYGVTAEMLRDFFKRVIGGTIFSRPKVLICVPYGVTEVEKRAVEDVTLDAGAQQVSLIEEPIAAAIGSGLRVGDAKGTIIIDIGGGTCEVAVLSLGGIVLARSTRIAGDAFDSAIVSYIRRKYNVSIGEATAELMKKKIGSAHPNADRGTMEIHGLNLSNGLPAILQIHSGEIREALSEQIVHIVDCIRQTLENTPPELSSDIYENGICMSGGVSLLAGLPMLVQQVTGIRTYLAKAPMDSVAIGIGKVIESQGADLQPGYKGN